jgi:hypothetical protein
VHQRVVESASINRAISVNAPSALCDATFSNTRAWSATGSRARL